MPPSKPRAAIYARVSTANGGQNPETQLRPCRELCRSRGWAIVEEYVDVGESGRKASRPALDDMLRAAGRREFKVLVIWKMDRLSRRGIGEVFDLLKRLDAMGVEVHSATEPYLSRDHPAWQLILAVMSWAAEMESRLIGERVKAGISRVRSQGKPWGRPREVAVDLRRARRLLREGHSLRQAASEMGVAYSTLRRSLRSGSTGIA